MPDKRLYKPEWFEPIFQGQAVSFRCDELPFEELLYLSELADQYPGLMFNLRKQRGRGKCYLLTIMPIRHLDKERDEVKGEP